MSESFTGSAGLLIFLPFVVYVPTQNVSLASLVQAASSHVTVQVEGHVTPGLATAASDVLQAFMEINVSWVRQKLL